MTARRFVVLFEARSGSSWLTEILDAHPELEVEFEPLAAFPGGVHGKLKEGNPQDAATLTAGQITIARSILTRPPVDGTAAIGFNTKLSDVLDVPAFAALLRAARTQIILLTRRNLVKQTVSLFRAERLAEATGDWNLYDEADRPPPFSIDPTVFDSWLRIAVAERERLSEFACGLALPMLCLQYEDLLADRAQALALVFSFLGIEPAEAGGRTRKNTSDDLREAMTNFAQLRSAYVGTEFEAMFDEALARA